MKYLSHNFKETFDIAFDFAKTLKRGAVILARGEMGAGKTAFAKGLAKGLGVEKEITSPTFNIMMVYPLDSLDFVHIDAYRLEDPKAWKNFGLEEVIGDQYNICYIEWDQFIKEYIDVLRRNVYVVNLKYISEKEREIEIEKIL